MCALGWVTLLVAGTTGPSYPVGGGSFHTSRRRWTSPDFQFHEVPSDLPLRVFYTCGSCRRIQIQITFGYRPMLCQQPSSAYGTGRRAHHIMRARSIGRTGTKFTSGSLLFRERRWRPSGCGHLPYLLCPRASPCTLHLLPKFLRTPRGYMPIPSAENWSQGCGASG